MSSEVTRATGYGPKGLLVEPSAPDCVAWEGHNVATGEKKYFVKQAVYGNDRGRMYNPRSTQAESLHATNGRLGEMYRFIKVTEEAFVNYVTFLRTGNLVCLRQAERAV